MQMKPTDWKLLCVRQNDPSFPCGLFFFLEMGGSALQIIPVIISAKDDCVRTITVRTLGQSWTRKSLCKLCRTLIWQFCFLVHVKLASLGFCFKSVWQSDFMISTRSPAINWVQPTKNNPFLNIRLISKGHHEMPKQSKAQWSSLGDDNEQLDHSELFCFYLFFPPDLLPDPVQAVFTIQTRTSAPSTTTWSLQRAAAWRRNPPRSQTRRCSSCSRILSGLCAWTVICLHDGVSVMCLYPSTCPHFHLLEFLGNSAFSLSAVRCFVSVHAVHTVSFSSVVHLSAFSLRGVIRYGYNAQGEMRD